MTQLFCYKLKNDTGFAPNPFWGVLSLANCKPRIRRHKKPGQWIAGFSSKALCGDPTGSERLIYLMEVTRKITFPEYFHAPEYECKKPNLSRRECIYRAGDNIYRPSSIHPRGFEQLPNCNHSKRDITKDLSGRFILLSDNFVYLGVEAACIPDNLRPNVPRGQSPHGSVTKDPEIVKRFVRYVFSKYGCGIKAPPHTWPENDNSWRMT